MEKKDIIKTAFILGIIVMFIAGDFYIGGGFFSSPTGGPGGGQNITGTSTFNGTIRTYDPYLFLPAGVNQSVLDELSTMEGFGSMRTEGQFIVIQTDTRDDVYPLAEWLRSKNLSPSAIANIAVSEIEVEALGGRINASVPQGVVRMETKPILDVDSEVAVTMTAVVSNNVLVDSFGWTIEYEELELLLDSKVESMEGSTYTYSIPWEERDSLGDLSAYDYQYKRIDTILFTEPLTTAQILAKKQFPYVTYIDASSAAVEPGFTNTSQLALNFADTNYTLPPSTLTIESETDPGLPYEPSVVRYYSIAPDWGEYEYGGGPLVFGSSEELEINSTMKLNVSALAVGKKIVSVRRAVLPS
ncbi:MAG: hypothetical protein AB1324_05675 [Candidatus Micrarchaeota archaeon]